MLIRTSISSLIRSLQLPVILSGLALFLYLDPLPFELRTSPQEIPAWAIDPSTVRQWQSQAEYKVGQFNYGCHECHKMWPESGKIVLDKPIHDGIELRHGINDRCLNCHHPSNRDTFVDNAGDSIPWNLPQLMCAKCHGPVYRDWQHGAHGRSEGYWNQSVGKQIRRRCVDCHDPHRPPFPPLAPAPGPQTFRMGPQRYELHKQEHDPLHPNRDGPIGGDDIDDSAAERTR